MADEEQKSWDKLVAEVKSLPGGAIIRFWSVQAILYADAVIKRAGDIEGMAKVIYEHMIELPWEEQVNMDTRNGYRDNALAVSAWIKEGKR